MLDFSQFQKLVICEEYINMTRRSPEYFKTLVSLFIRMDPEDPSAAYFFTNKKRKLLRIYIYDEPKPLIIFTGLDQGTYKWEQWCKTVGTTLTADQIRDLMDGMYPDPDEE